MKIGILGGGQLAMMLTRAARRLGHHVTVLSPPQEPAVEAADEVILGGLTDVTALEEVFRRVEVITVESELLDVSLVRELQAKYPHVRFLPQAAAMEVARDKLAQKALFQRCGLATVPHLQLSGKPSAQELATVAQELGGNIVIKWARGGHDGHGVMRWAKGEDDQPALDFWTEAVRRDVPLFAEAHVAFTGEAAMVAVRHASGEFANWPLMFTRQREGTCREVYGPAIWIGLDEATEKAAQRAAETVGRELGYSGVFALEFFLTRAGLLVNEMAPRVHNSGHFTLHAGEESQFSAHIRAVTNMPLVVPSLDQIAYTRNLLGPVAREFDAVTVPEVTPPPGVSLVWYGKRRSKPRRKMGHLTARCASVDNLRDLREQTCFWEQHFWSVVRNASGEQNTW